jgi:hypothetical protein
MLGLTTDKTKMMKIIIMMMIIIIMINRGSTQVRMMETKINISMYLLDDADVQFIDS